MTVDIARLIDHTLLRPDATRRDIDRVCEEAVRLGCASVCVNPFWCTAAAKHVEGTPVSVCSVVGFPFGATPASMKIAEAGRAIEDGAREVDFVINVGALKSGYANVVAQEIESVVRTCRAAGALCKVILEAAFLNDEEKMLVCRMARATGAAFVKTSTGFGPSGATVHDVRLFRSIVGPSIGVKAAGGIRDLATLRSLLDAGASRIGSSASVRILEELALERRTRDS